MSEAKKKTAALRTSTFQSHERSWMMVVVTTSASSIFFTNRLEEEPNRVVNVLLAINGPVMIAPSSRNTSNDALWPAIWNSGFKKNISKKARIRLRVVDIHAIDIRVVMYRVYGTLYF